MKVHALKTHRRPFAAQLAGEKNFEVRNDDRGFEVGDELLLQEWDEELDVHLGRSLRRRVTYLLRGPPWRLPEGLVVLSTAPIVEAVEPDPITTLFLARNGLSPLDTARSWERLSASMDAQDAVDELARHGDAHVCTLNAADCARLARTLRGHLTQQPDTATRRGR